jgi:hypothetical protein
MAGNVVNREQSQVKFDTNKLHQAIGYCPEEAFQITAKSYNWKLLGKLETCKEIVLLEKQSKRSPINRGYNLARILEKEFTLTLVPFMVKAFRRFQVLGFDN